MQYSLQYSLRKHLADKFNVPVIWIYDGVKLPSEDDKPYITIEQMQDNDEGMTKYRESVEVIHRFQIGLFARTASERSLLQGTISKSFRFDDINLIDATSKEMVGVFNTKLTGVVPMTATSVDGRSDYHRVYFDVEIAMYYYKN